MLHDWNVTSDFIWMQLHHVLVELRLCGGSNVHRKQFSGGRVSTEEFSTSEKLLLLHQKALVLSERLLMFLLQVLVVREFFM